MTANRSRPGARTEAATEVLAGGLNWYQDTTRGIDGARFTAPLLASVASCDALPHEGVR